MHEASPGALPGCHVNSSLFSDIRFDFIYSSSLHLPPGKLIGIGLCQGAGRMRHSSHSRHEETFESGWSDDLDPADDDDEEKRFCSMMEQLGAAQLFEE